MKNTVLIMAGVVCCLLLAACSANVASQRSELLPERHIVDNYDGTITDVRTRLQWTKDDFTPGPRYCYSGIAKGYRVLWGYVDCLNKNNYLGYNDWRVPTNKELDSLLNTTEADGGGVLKPQVIEMLRHHKYWCSVDFAIFIYNRRILVYDFTAPVIRDLHSDLYPIWPVRSETRDKLVASSD